jgi:hypothetical protein
MCGAEGACAIIDCMGDLNLEMLGIQYHDDNSKV